MYISNGIELSARQFFTLKRLVDESKRAGTSDVTRAAKQIMYDDEERGELNLSGFYCIERFYELGFMMGDFNLLLGNPDWIFLVSPSGVDFVDDIEISAKIEESAEKSRRRHNYIVASFGILGGFFSGALGSWLFGWLSHFATVLS